jgi:hypothetical protein
MLNTCRIINGLFGLMARRSHGRFVQALARPAKTQAELLARCIRQNADTQIGRKYHFEKIIDIGSFQKNVPLSGYEDYEPSIAAIRRGEKNILTAQPPRRLLPTGGSTGGLKLIPYTPRLLKQFDAAIYPWLWDTYRQYPAAKAGPAYWSVSPAMQSGLESAIPIGFDNDLSYLGPLFGRLLQPTLAAPSSLRHVQPLSDFQYLTALHLLNSPNLRLISCWHPSFCDLILDAIMEHRDVLLTDIATGQLTGIESPDNKKATLGKPNPKRAEFLRQLNWDPPGVFQKIWPDLKLLSCWADANAAAPASRLIERMGSPFQPKGIIATEAMVSIPFQGQFPAAVTSHFFEFVGDDGLVFLLEELEVGHSYQVVVTTGAGLYRYRMGDRVEVTGRMGQTPTLRFLGRCDSQCDLVGEKLTDALVGEAIRNTLASLEIPVTFAMLAPDDRPGYTLFMESNNLEEIPRLLQRLESKLTLNPQYQYARDLGQLQPVRLFRIRYKGQETYLHQKAATGQKLGDIKPAALDCGTQWASHFEGSFLE